MREVAQRAQVSPTTVSHVINNTRYVSVDVRERVLLAMQEIGYRPNALARSLRQGKTFTIGLIVPDSANPYFAEISHFIEVAAFHLGYNVILCNTDGDHDREKIYVDLLIKKQVDGIIFVAAGDKFDSLSSILKENIPVVLVDRLVPGADVDVVLSDNFNGGFVAANHLLNLGHKRIAFISGPSNVTPSSERTKGYLQVMTDAGFSQGDTLVIPGNFRVDSGHKISCDLLSMKTPPTAIFCGNDLMAIGALRAAAQKRLHVPEDVSIIGFDDIELASYTTPTLTTVRQPISTMAENAVDLLIARTKDRNKAPELIKLQNELIVRDSTGYCP
jgi:LacI family transcriptional regulator